MELNIMQSILAILTDIRPEFDFVSSSDFIVDKALDSFDLITLIARLEQAYNISIEGMDIVPENFKNIAAIENLLNKYGINL